jgi:precorrin-4 methylase
VDADVVPGVKGHIAAAGNLAADLPAAALAVEVARAAASLFDVPFT